MDSTNENLSHSNKSCIHYSFDNTCQDRVCSEYGDGHSFRNNFAELVTSIDIISELLYGVKLTVKEVLN